MCRHKKGSSARTKRSKHPSLAPSPSTHPSLPPEKMIVIEELELAVAAVRGRDFSTALKLVDDSLSRYPDSAVLHSIKGAIHFQAASQTHHDSAAQVEHLKSSLDGDRRALQLAPNSVSFARYYAHALFELAQNDAAVEYDYNAVIDACERALLLDNPTDPVEDLLGVGGMAYVDPSPVGRIEEVKKNLVNLMEESKKNKKSTLLVDEIGSLQVQRRKEEIIEPSPQNHALFRPSPDDWPRIEEKRNHYKNLNIRARANIKRTPEAGCSYTYEPESDPLVFDRFSVYNSCFPRVKILEWWFSNHGNEPQVRVELPPSIHSDSNWIGLALFASFSVCEHSLAILEDLEQETCLLCCLETDVDSIEPHHVYRPTRADFKLIHLGGCMWLFYIPRWSLPGWLSISRRIEAFIFSDSPSLRAQNFGLRLLFRHNEGEFMEAIRHCVALLSDSRDLICRNLAVDLRQRNKQIHDDDQTRAKDKGKRVLLE